MNGRRIIVVSAAAIILACASFDAGRHTEMAREAKALEKQSQSNADGSFKTRAVTVADEHGRLLIGNIANVSFEELYDLLRAVSSEKRSEWAKELEAMPAGPRKDAAIGSFCRTLVQIDAKAATQLVLAAQDPRTRIVAAEAVSGAAPVPEIWRVLEMFHDVAASDKDMEWYNPPELFWSWCQADPEAAAGFLAAHPDWGEIEYQKLLYNWGAIEPAAAMAWFESQDSSKQTAEAWRGLLTGWLDSDQTAAVDFLVAHASEDKFKGALTDVSREVFRRSPADARSLVLRLPDAQKQAQAVDDIESLAGRVWLHTPRDFMRPSSEVAKWLITLPENLWGDQLGEVVSMWGDYPEGESTEDFSAWLTQLPVEIHDRVISAYCGGGGEDTKALALAESISDPRRREDALRRLICRSGRNRDQALEFIANLHLSREQQRQLTRLAPPE